MLLNRIRPSLYMSGWMMAWAVVSTLMSVVKDYKGMIACRFVLGITEAPFYPGGVYLISMFYTRKESATRMSVFYTGNLLASAFSGLIAAPIFSGMEGRHGLEGWRWLFIIQGLITGKSKSSGVPQTCAANHLESGRCYPCFLYASQCTSADTMAHAGGARTRPQQNRLRYHRKGEQSKRLEGTSRSLYRLPHVVIRADAKYASFRQR